MSDEKSSLRRAFELAVVTGGVQGGAAIFAGATIEQGLATGLAQAISVMIGAVRSTDVRRAQLLLAGAARGDEAPNEDVLDEDVLLVMEEACASESGREVIRETMRRLAETLDPAVVPTLGKLMREYLDAKKAPDAYLRGMMCVLSDLSAAELAELRLVFLALAQTASGMADSDENELPMTDHSGSLVAEPKNNDSLAHSASVANAHRLVMLLTTNHIAIPSRVWGDAASMKVGLQMIHRVHKLLSGASVAA